MATPFRHPRYSRDADPRSLRVAVRNLAESAKSSSARLRFAHQFIYRAVDHYWKGHVSSTDANSTAARLRRCFLPLDSSGLSSEAELIAQRLGAAAASLEPISAAYLIGRMYMATLPSEMRISLGIYYTPPVVADRLLNHAERAGIDWTRATVLDPACGGGAFLAPVASRMASAMKRSRPENVLSSIEGRLRGYEVDPFSAWISQVFVDAVLVRIAIDVGRSSETIVRIQDTLEAPLPRTPGFDLVIGNPPYGKTRLTPERRERYARSLYGHANLYGLFTDYALRVAGAAGIVCYVTPTSFLGGEYFKRLRALLANNAPPEAIDFLRDRDGIFDDVLQETLLATYRKSPPRRITVSLVQPSGGSLEIQALGSFRLPHSPGHPWILPRSRAETPIARRLGELGHRLADWGYSVSTGPLVWNRYKNRLRHRSGPHRVPLIWAEAVCPDGVFRFRADRKNHAPFFEVLPGDAALLVDEPCVLVQRTTAREQHRRLIAAELPSAFLASHRYVTVENHLNMVKPLIRPKLVDRADQQVAISPTTVAAFLNTKVVDRAFRCVSGSVAVSAFELESLPVPDPRLLPPVDEAVRHGAPAAEIERLCAKLYGF